MAIDKKSAAQELFNAGWEQNRIASILNISEQSISAWKNKHNWEEKRAKKNMAADVAEDTIWELINYQLKALKQKKEQYELLAETNKENKDLPMLDKGDIDALQKLWTTVKNKQLDWSVIVNNIKDFVSYISERDLDLAKKILTHSDDYLNFKRKNL
jgi:predicted transcriptional regulator